MLLTVFVWNEYFGGYLDETWHAFIVYMFRWRPEVLHSVGDNALISGFGKGPIPGASATRNFTYVSGKRPIENCNRGGVEELTDIVAT